MRDDGRRRRDRHQDDKDPEGGESPEDTRARLNRLVEAGYLRLHCPEGATSPVYLPTAAGARAIGRPPDLVPRGDPSREEVARRLTLVDLTDSLTRSRPGAEWLTPTELEVEARRRGLRVVGPLAAGELHLPAPATGSGRSPVWAVEVALTDPDTGRIEATLRRWRRHPLYDRVLYFARGERTVRGLRSLVERLGLSDWVTVDPLPAELPDRLKTMGSPLASS